MYSDSKTAHFLSLCEVNVMKDKKEKRPDPKVLNAVVVAHKLAKGIYSKPEEKKR